MDKTKNKAGEALPGKARIEEVTGSFLNTHINYFPIDLLNIKPADWSYYQEPSILSGRGNKLVAVTANLESILSVVHQSLPRRNFYSSQQPRFWVSGSGSAMGHGSLEEEEAFLDCKETWRENGLLIALIFSGTNHSLSQSQRFAPHPSTSPCGLPVVVSLFFRRSTNRVKLNWEINNPNLISCHQIVETEFALPPTPPEVEGAKGVLGDTTLIALYENLALIILLSFSSSSFSFILSFTRDFLDFPRPIPDLSLACSLHRGRTWALV